MIDRVLAYAASHEHAAVMPDQAASGPGAKKPSERAAERARAPRRGRFGPPPSRSAGPSGPKQLPRRSRRPRVSPLTITARDEADKGGDDFRLRSAGRGVFAPCGSALAAGRRFQARNQSFQHATAPFAGGACPRRPAAPAERWFESDARHPPGSVTGRPVSMSTGRWRSQPSTS